MQVHLGSGQSRSINKVNQGQQQLHQTSAISHHKSYSKHTTMASAASATSIASSFSMSNEDVGLTDMTGESEFDAFFKSNDTNSTTTGEETKFSAASSRPSRDSKKSKKSKKKRSSKSSKKERGESSSSPKSPSNVKKDALFEKMLDAMGGEFTGEFTHSDFGDFADINAEADSESQAWDGEGGQDNMSKKSGRIGNMSTRTPATRNATGTTDGISRNAGFTNGATSANVKLIFDNIEFPEENLFDAGFGQHQQDDPVEDDDSVLSDVSGLTGVFSSDQTAMYDDEDDEGYLPEILPIQMHVPQVAPSGRIKQHKGISKELRFANVETRYYERIMTLNPSTIQGPSVGIGWRFSGERTDEIDFYENNRGPQRPSGMLVLNRDQRENLLLELGYTKKQLAVAVRANTKGRNQRRQTVQNVKAQKVEEALEGAKGRVKRIMNPFARRKA
jgi:hypothetical protein